jgi:hypothetical protein
VAGARRAVGAFAARHVILWAAPDRHEDQAKNLLAASSAIVTSDRRRADGHLPLRRGRSAGHACNADFAACAGSLGAEKELDKRGGLLISTKEALCRRLHGRAAHHRVRRRAAAQDKTAAPRRSTPEDRSMPSSRSVWTRSIRAAKPLLARLLHRQSVGALTGRAAFPSHGLRSRNRLDSRAPSNPAGTERQHSGVRSEHAGDGPRRDNGGSARFNGRAAPLTTA